MLKGYWQFYREMNEFIDDEKNKLTIEDVNEAFQDLIDAGYRIEMYEHLTFNPLDVFEGDCEGVDTILTSEEYYIFYDIVIRDARTNPFEGDFTDDFLTGIDVIETLDVMSIDTDKPLPEGYNNIDGEIKTGFSFTHINDIKLVNGNIFEKEEKLTQVSIFFIEPNPKQFTPKEIAEKMEWTGYEVYENGTGIYIDIEKQDLVYMCVPSKHDYYDTLHDGIDYDNYLHYSHDYQPSIESLFQYDLNDENSILLTKAIIEEVGGVEEIIEQLDLEVGEDISDNTEEALIEYFITDRNWNRFKDIDSGKLDDVRQNYGDWAAQAHASETEEDIMDAFESELSSEDLGFDKSFYKEENKVSTYTDNEGVERTSEWVEKELMYRFMFCDEWVKNIDINDFKKYSLEDVFNEFISEYGDVNPSARLPEYGSVDDKQWNKEILEYYLKN